MKGQRSFHKFDMVSKLGYWYHMNIFIGPKLFYISPFISCCKNKMDLISRNRTLSKGYQNGTYIFCT